MGIATSHHRFRFGWWTRLTGASRTLIHPKTDHSQQSNSGHNACPYETEPGRANPRQLKLPSPLPSKLVTMPPIPAPVVAFTHSSLLSASVESQAHATRHRGFDASSTCISLL